MIDFEARGLWARVGSWGGAFMPVAIKVKYLYNSGFAIDFDKYYIVLDYEKGKLDLPKDKKIIFVVSHSHADHYNPAIFSMPGSEKASYVISDDVESCNVYGDGKFIKLTDSAAETERKKIIYNPKRCFRAKPDMNFEFAGLDWNTFKSTDLGISTLFSVNGVSFFHAGDLTAWKWPNTPIQEQKKEVADYEAILDDIANYPVDIAFAPLDPRLMENAYLGSIMLIKKLNPQLFIPMHFRETPQITRAFKEYFQGQTTTYISTIEYAGQDILIN